MRRGLAAAGVSVLTDEGDVARDERQSLRAHFESSLARQLIPVVVGPNQPFPFVRDGEIVLAAELDTGKAIVRLSAGTPRFVPLSADAARFIAVETALVGPHPASRYLEHSRIVCFGNGAGRLQRSGKPRPRRVKPPACVYRADKRPLSKQSRITKRRPSNEVRP